MWVNPLISSSSFTSFSFTIDLLTLVTTLALRFLLIWYVILRQRSVGRLAKALCYTLKSIVISLFSKYVIAGNSFCILTTLHWLILGIRQPWIGTLLARLLLFLGSPLILWFLVTQRWWFSRAVCRGLILLLALVVPFVITFSATCWE